MELILTQRRRGSSHDSDSDSDDSEEYGNHGRTLYVHPMLRVAVSGLSGMLFGIALEKGRVFEPQVIRDQMLFRRFVMLKMFLSATAAGVVSFTVLSMFRSSNKALRLSVKTFDCSLSGKTVLGVSIGAAILGTGMTIAGSCPGQVLVQIGAGVPNAVTTFAGSIFGAILYAFTYPMVSQLLHSKKQSGPKFLDTQLHVPYISIAIPMVIGLSAIIAVTEYFFPWYKEVPVTEEAVGLMKSRAWPPFLTGILVGSLQIPIVLANQDTLGSSSSYATLASQILIIKPLESILAYLKSYRYGLKNWWQVFYIGGAVMGAYLSAQASSTWGTVAGVVPSHGFIGGLLMMYGSRLAGGCTSGHGLSGIGLLSLLSFVAVPFMFKGGVLTAFLMQYLGFQEFQ